MKNFLFTGACLSAILSAKALAQTAPPIAFDTRLDPATGARYVEQIVLDRGGEIKAYQFNQLVRPTVEAYAQAPAQIPVAFGNPAPVGTPTGLTQDTGADLPATPTGSDRINVLTDNLVNSAMLNIAQDKPGLVLSFPEGLQNAPGANLILAELSLAKGEQSNGCPGIPAPGADSLTIAVPNGESVTISGESFGVFGVAGAIANYGADRLRQKGARIDNLEELEQGNYEPMAAIDYFRTWVVAVDLSDLGIPEGESVEQIELRSAGVISNTEAGERNCWLIDPAMVMGLPAE